MFKDESQRFPEDVKRYRSGKRVAQIALALAVLGVATDQAAPGAEPPTGPGGAPAAIRESAHFRLETSCAPQDSERILQRAEALWGLYSRLLTNAPSSRLNLLVFATRNEFIAKSAARGYRVGADIGAFYWPGVGAKTGVFMAWQDHGGMGPEAWLQHELFHAFYHAAMKTDEPAWLNEGLACYYESLACENGQLRDGVLNRNRLLGLKATFERGRLEPLPALLQARLGKMSVEQYEAVWGLVFFLLQPSSPTQGATDRRKLLGDYLLAARNSSNRNPEAFAKAMRTDLAKLEADWHAWLKAALPDPGPGPDRVTNEVKKQPGRTTVTSTGTVGGAGTQKRVSGRIQLSRQPGPAARTNYLLLTPDGRKLLLWGMPDDAAEFEKLRDGLTCEVLGIEERIAVEKGAKAAGFDAALQVFRVTVPQGR